MVSKSHDHKLKQVPAKKAPESTSSSKVATQNYNSREVTLEDIERNMENKGKENAKHGEGSREGDLGSRNDTRNSDSINEEDLMKSFASITDALDEDKDVAGDSKPNGNNNNSSFSRSEDGDSLDEEVRTIMSKGKKPMGKENGLVTEREEVEDVLDEEEEEDMDEDDEGEQSSQEEEEEEDEEEGEEADSDTDSDEEEDDQSELSVSEVQVNSESSEDDSEEFNLDEYIDKLIAAGTDSDSETSRASSVCSDIVAKKAVRRKSRHLKRGNSSINRGNSDSDSDTSDSDSEDELENSDVNSESGSHSGRDSEQTSVFSSEDSEDTCSELDFSDEASISSESSLNESGTGMFNLENGEDPDSSHLTNEDTEGHVTEPKPDPRDIIYTHYLSDTKQDKPDKIELQDAEIGHSTHLDTTLGSRSVIDLRWPFTSYYVKELNQLSPKDGGSPDPSIFQDEGLMPSYKSYQTSASFPGRRRNVMLGRVWWVEWWAKDSVDSHDEDYCDGTHHPNVYNSEQR